MESRTPVAFHRKSACCGKPVIHPFPWTSKAWLADQVVCAECGEAADNFRVMSSTGVQVWPVPDDFEPPADFIGFDFTCLWRRNE